VTDLVRGAVIIGIALTDTRVDSDVDALFRAVLIDAAFATLAVVVSNAFARYGRVRLGCIGREIGRGVAATIARDVGGHVRRGVVRSVADDIRLDILSVVGGQNVGSEDVAGARGVNLAVRFVTGDGQKEKGRDPRRNAETQ